MAINKKLIHYNKEEDFLKDLNAGNIKTTSIVWIKDIQKIFTHNWGLQGIPEGGAAGQILYMGEDKVLRWVNFTDISDIFVENNYYTKEDIDSVVLKGLLIDGAETEINPYGGYIAIDGSEGIDITKNTIGAITLRANTEYLATKDDLKSKANNSEVIKYIGINAEYTVYPDEYGFINIDGAEGIKIREASGNITISADTDYLATRTYVDDKINFLVNEEGVLEDSFDTLKEVDTWIKQHEEEAANLLTDVNKLNSWRTQIGAYTAQQTYQVNSKADSITLAGNYINLGTIGSGAGTKTLFTLDAATTEKAGVMSAEDKAKIDGLNEYAKATDVNTINNNYIKHILSGVTASLMDEASNPNKVINIQDIVNKTKTDFYMSKSSSTTLRSGTCSLFTVAMNTGSMRLHIGLISYINSFFILMNDDDNVYLVQFLWSGDDVLNGRSLWRVTRVVHLNPSLDSINEELSQLKEKVDSTPSFWTGTQDEYDKLSDKDENTFYFIKEEV